MPGFSGGFLGVDIFFVISGFLITSILLREMRDGKLSIVKFYNRRIRRIFPALFVLLAATTLAAAVLLAPSDLTRYAKTLIATTFFASNIKFFMEAGYFDTSTLEKPLLHTWSLAVEEQFYLAWPVILTLFVSWGKRAYIIPFVVIGTAVSFILAAVGSYYWPVATFYMPFTRAWELGLGAALAAIGRPGLSRRNREGFAVVGLAMVIGAIVFATERTPMVIASGLACAGTTVLIACNSERTFVGTLLSLPLAVGIGLISYSLYLWHWPLLAFAHYYYDADPPTGIRLALVLTAVAAAYLSWQLVERPLRRPGPPRRAFAAACIAMASIAAVGVALIVTKGLPQRFPKEIVRADAARGKTDVCDGCLFGSGREPEIVLWGDSHAGAISGAIRDLADRYGAAGIEFTHAACPPLLGAQPYQTDRDESAACRRFQDRTLRALQNLRRSKLIILAGRWAMSTETTRFGDEDGGRYFLRDELTANFSREESRRAFQSALGRTVATLRSMHPSAKILLLGQAPEVGFNAPDCAVRRMMFGRDLEPCVLARPGSRQRLAFSDQAIRQVEASDPQVDALFISKLLCEERCRAVENDLPLYADEHHLSSRTSSRLLGNCLGEQAAPVLNPRPSGGPRPSCPPGALSR